MYEFSASSYLNKLLRLVLWAAHLPLLLAVLWVIGLFFCLPESTLLLIPFLIVALRRLSQKKLQHVRTWIAFFCLAEFAFFLYLPGPTHRHWQEGTAQDTTITWPINDVVHLNYIRDFIYHGRKKADVRYLEEDFNIQDITGVYLAECVSGKGLTDCHLMLSFAFRDGRYLVVSPEMRLPIGEKENALRRHYKNYGLFYLFGTEEDIFALHTDEHHDYLSLYPLKADLPQAQAMLAVCLEQARGAQEKCRAYHPLQQIYYNDLLGALRIICPELPESKPTHNANVAKLLYHNGATLIPEKGDWPLIRRRYAVGYDLRPEPRESYSDLIRKRQGIAARETLPTRHVQDISKEGQLSMPQDAATGVLVTTPMSMADIPEPGDRLKNESSEEKETTDKPQEQAAEQTETTDTPPATDTSDREDESAAEHTRKLNEQESLLPAKPSIANGILEPGARLHADNRREEEEEAAMNESRKRAAEGRDIMDNDREKSSDGSNFNELFFGKRKSGITIIEKEKPKEEAHPLDPIRKQKRRDPFDDEDKKRQQEQQKPQEVDPFAPKAPIHI